MKCPTCTEHLDEQGVCHNCQTQKYKVPPHMRLCPECDSIVPKDDFNSVSHLCYSCVDRELSEEFDLLEEARKYG